MNRKENIIFLKPYFDYKIWGGSQLKQYGYKGNEKIGEALVISALEAKESLILNKKYKDQNLNQFFLKNREFFGNYQGEYPILTKIIDANDDLSVQVHPGNNYAKKHFNKWGKTECWYILEAKENASIIYGSKVKSLKEIKEKLQKNDWSFLNELSVKKGDFINVPAGTIHAIKSGILTYELQQSSDLTFRLYDYNRKDKDGNYRDLHIKDSLNVINFNHSLEIKESLKTSTLLVDNPEFSLYKLIIDNKSVNLDFLELNYWIEGFVIEGKGTIDDFNISKGSAFIVGNSHIPCFSGKLEILISYIKRKKL